MTAPASTKDDGILVTWRESPAASKAMLAGIVINRLGAFIQVFLVLFLTTRGFTPVQAGTALGLYTTGAVLGVLVGGSMTDRLGARATVLISMIGSAGLILSILYLRDYAALVAAVFVVGLVSGAYRPASTALLSELTPPHRQVMIFAMYRLAYNVGSAAAPVIAVGLIAVSYDLLFWAEAVAALGYAAIAAFALPRRTADAAPASPSASPASSLSSSSSSSLSSSSESSSSEAAEGVAGGSGYLAVLRDYRYALYLVAMAINAAVYVQYLSTLPVSMRDAGLSTAWYAAMVTLNGVVVITCELLMTKVTQRWPMRLVVATGFVLLGVGLAFYALPYGAIVFVVGTLIWTLAEIIAGPAVFAYGAIAGPARLRGRYLAAGTAAFGVGSATGSLTGLAVYNQVGSWVWVWCAVACAVGMAAGWFGMRLSAIRAAAASAPVTPVDAAPTPTGAAPTPVDAAATPAGATGSSDAEPVVLAATTAEPPTTSALPSALPSSVPAREDSRS